MSQLFNFKTTKEDLAINRFAEILWHDRRPTITVEKITTVSVTEEAIVYKINDIINIKLTSIVSQFALSYNFAVLVVLKNSCANK